jgi:hypothetical protein
LHTLCPTLSFVPLERCCNFDDEPPYPVVCIGDCEVSVKQLFLDLAAALGLYDDAPCSAPVNQFMGVPGTPIGIDFSGPQVIFIFEGGKRIVMPIFAPAGACVGGVCGESHCKSEPANAMDRPAEEKSDCQRQYHAGKLLREAEALAEDGFVIEACACCELVCRICPNSCFAMQAAEMMDCLGQNYCITRTASDECQEPEAAPRLEKKKPCTCPAEKSGCQKCPCGDKCCCEDKCDCGKKDGCDAKCPCQPVKADKKCPCDDRCCCEGKCDCGKKDGCNSNCPCQAPVKQEPTCPYLRQQEQKKQSTKKPVPVEDATPISNIEKLERAAKMYEEAEVLAHQGEMKKACALYTSIRKLCPGSRYDQMAAERLAGMGGAVDAIGEEQETPPAKPKKPAPNQPQSLRPCLPPIDAGVVRAFDAQIQKSEGQFGVCVIDQRAGVAEELLSSGQAEVATVQVEATPATLVLVGPKGGEEASEVQEEVFRRQLLDLLEKLGVSACIDVDQTNQGLRARCQVQSGVTIKVEVRGDGHGSFTFGIPLYIGAPDATTNAKPVEAREVQFLKALQALWGSPTCIEVEKKDRDR